MQQKEDVNYIYKFKNRKGTESVKFEPPSFTPSNSKINISKCENCRIVLFYVKLAYFPVIWTYELIV